MENIYKTKKEMIFDLKKEILSYKHRIDNGESLPDMIDDILQNNGIVFAINKDGKSDKQVKSLSDVSFFCPVNGKIHEFKPVDDKNNVENQLLMLHTGYLLSINPINMESTKNYSISKTASGVMKAFNSLEPLSKLLKKELNFPKSSK